MERSNHFSQVIARHADIAVVDDEIRVPGLRQHLQEIADLEIHSEDIAADNQPHRKLGKFRDQPFNCRHCGIVRRSYSKDDFVVRVILNTMTPQTLITMRIQAAQRLQNGNRRRKIASRRFAVVKVKFNGRPKRQETIRDSKPRGNQEKRVQENPHRISSSRLELHRGKPATHPPSARASRVHSGETSPPTRRRRSSEPSPERRD